MEKNTFLASRFLVLIFCFTYYLHISANVKADDNDFFHYDNDSISFFDSVFNPEPVVSDPLVEKVDLNVSTKMHKRRELVENRLTEETKIRILELHNIYRGNVTPPAGNMAFMEWDDDLEHLAQLWADICSFEHGKPPNTSYHGTYGQNLYIGTDPKGLLGLWMWYDEYHDYDFYNKTCPTGMKCGHYVTMAWAESNKLGCAMRSCGFRYYLVCHYSPGALRSLPIYDLSRPCSQCPTKPGQLCYNNLCMTKEQCQRNPEKCKSAKCKLKCQNCGRLNKTDCMCNCADGWDSYDCSRLCANSHEKCEKKPGFPNKATCSMNRNAVANVYCRKMCERCNPLLNNTKVSHICCEGRLCPNGYVLDPVRKCRCKILCPGPLCDDIEDSGVIIFTNIVLIVISAMLLNFYSKKFVNI